jgi:ribonuclease P protein component
MPRIARQMTLWHRKEIQVLFKRSQKVYTSAGLVIAIAPRSHQDFARLLIIIPKKVGSAPERNLIRRRIKAIFYEHKLFTGNIDWLFFVKPASKSLDFATLKNIILTTQKNVPGSS